MTRTPGIIFTCEHAVNHIPESYQNVFAPYETLLNSHRGIDFGALSIAKYLSEHMTLPLITAKTSRLLIDCNRSLSHPTCFSEVSEKLAEKDKKHIINNYYTPYREKVEQLIRDQIKAHGAVIHLSIHSFTPVFDGIERNADIGLLYDPRRPGEKEFSTWWKQALKTQAPKLQVRMNYPYQGTSDGFTTALRDQFSKEQYSGIEVETNQRLLKHHEPSTEYLAVLLSTLRTIA